MAETLNLPNQVINSNWKDDVDVDYAIYGGNEQNETEKFINPSQTEENPEAIEKIKQFQIKQLAINSLWKHPKHQKLAA